MPPDPHHREAADSLLQARLKALGLALRQRRESSGCSLEELAQRLHMGLEQLRALEAGDGRKLPELVFVIAQARRIASCLDLRIDDLIDDLRQSVPASALSEPIVSEAEDLQETGLSAQRGLRTGLAPTALGRRFERLAERLNERLPEPPAPLRPWLKPLLAVTLLAGVVSAGATLWSQGARGPLARPETPSATVPPAGTGGRPLLPQAEAPRAAGAGMLVLRASAPSWVEVRTASGDTLHFAILRGERRFPIRDGLRLLAGRPDLIRVSTGSQPVRVLGRIDDVRWWSIQPDGTLKPLAVAVN